MAQMREVQSTLHGSSEAVHKKDGVIAEGKVSPPAGGEKRLKVLHESKSGLFELPNSNQPRSPMEHINTATPKKPFKHFTWEERVRLETLCRALYPGKKNPNLSELARLMGRHRSTISREYQRAKVVNINSEHEQFDAYSARKGQDKADTASGAKGPRGKLTNHIAADLADMIINEKLSPYAALIRLAQRKKHSWLPSERSVYYAINEGLLGVTREQLPYKPRAKKRKRTGTRMAYNNPKGRSIEERPEAANDRSEYGHWEMDTVVGGRGCKPACLLVLTERMSREQIIRKISSRSQKPVVRALNTLERQYGSDAFSKVFNSITADNGCEFLDVERIEQSVDKKAGKRTEIFFAHPYTSSERGSNENANRIVRRFIPKGVDISKYSKAEIQRVEDWMNALPRKLFDGLSAKERVKLYFMENAA